MKTDTKNYDLRKLLKPYANQWVALSRDQKKVVANGKNLKSITTKVESKNVVFLKVFPIDSFYMPGIYEI